MTDPQPSDPPEPAPADELPAIDLTELAKLFGALHEMYLEAVRSGFSRWEALTLLGSFMAAQGAKPNDGDQ